MWGGGGSTRMIGSTYTGGLHEEVKAHVNTGEFMGGRGGVVLVNGEM